MRAEVDAKGTGFDARRITVTRPDGQEINQIVGIDRECEDDIEELVEKVLEILPDNTQLRQAVIVKLTERVLDLASETLPRIGEKRQDGRDNVPLRYREDGQKTGYA